MGYMGMPIGTMSAGISKSRFNVKGSYGREPSKHDKVMNENFYFDEIEGIVKNKNFNKMSEVVKEKTFTKQDAKEVGLIFLGLVIVAFVFSYGFAAGGFITVASWVVFGGSLVGLSLLVTGVIGSIRYSLKKKSSEVPVSPTVTNQERNNEV